MAQLSGLKLNTGEPIGYPTAVTLGVTITNPAGQGATSAQNVPLTVNPIPPTVGDSVLLPNNQPGETLVITGASDDADGGADYINRIGLTGLPPGVSLSVPPPGFTLSSPTPVGGADTITTSGHPGSVAPHLQLLDQGTSTSGGGAFFTLGITDYAAFLTHYRLRR